MKQSMNSWNWTMDEPKEWNNGWHVEKLDKGWICITRTMDEHKGFWIMDDIKKWDKLMSPKNSTTKDPYKMIRWIRLPSQGSERKSLGCPLTWCRLARHPQFGCPW